MTMKRRWYNLFAKDNKSFILAMDHGALLDISGSLTKPGEVIEKALRGGVDTILTTYGVAQHCQKEIGNAGLLLRIDGGTTQLHPSGYVMDKVTPTFSVEDAVQLGADGVICMGFTGVEDEDKMVRDLAHTAIEAKKWGVVFGVEMVPGGFKDEAQRTVDNIAFSSRLGAEYGADFIKTAFAGDAESFKKVIENCFKPVLVLGGGSARTDKDILSMIRMAMDAGASGVVMGRNIWKHENVEKLCSAIAKIIHEDASVEKAFKVL